MTFVTRLAFQLLPTTYRQNQQHFLNHTLNALEIRKQLYIKSLIKEKKNLINLSKTFHGAPELMNLANDANRYLVSIKLQGYRKLPCFQKCTNVLQTMVELRKVLWSNASFTCSHLLHSFIHDRNSSFT